MSAILEFVILGSGSSGGVPRADGAWGACDPTDWRNRRSRCSLLVRRKSVGEGADRETTIVVDASPEFRLQTAAAGVKRLDALLLTHDHADQCHGIDDIRAFFLHQRARIPCWMDPVTRTAMERRFGYIFAGATGPYPAIADIHDVPAHGEHWKIDGPSGAIPIMTFDQDHGSMRSLGYRFGSMAYSSDVVDLPEESFKALEGLETWVLDALRYTPHPTHSTVEQSLKIVAEVKPKRAFFTHICHDLPHDETNAKLPQNVQLAYDGMKLEFEI